MSETEAAPMHLTRRAAAAALLGVSALVAARKVFASTVSLEDRQMALTCFIRYRIDPFQRDAFAAYASTWGGIIPRCGGDLIGYFLPHEGTNDIGWGLIAFDSLASYEAYRARLRADPASRDNFAFAQQRKFILREERTFLESVPGTISLPRTS